MTTTTDKTLDQMLAEAQPTLVEFMRAGNARSEEESIIIDGLKARFDGRANIVAVDGSHNQDLMRAYKVGSYPTFILFKDGQQAWRDSGHKTYEELAKMIESFV